MKLLFSDIGMESNNYAYNRELITVRMTSQEKVRIVKSVYGNENYYSIASYIFSHKNCSNSDIIQATGLHKTTVSLALSNMAQAGVIMIEPDNKDGRERCIIMTELGKKLMRII